MILLLPRLWRILLGLVLDRLALGEDHSRLEALRRLRAFREVR